MNECQGSTAYSLEKDRAYDGQSHTHNGIRGKEMVKGLTVRDITDCIVKGFLDASGGIPLNPVHDDIYNIDLSKRDPGAIIQNTVCHIEKMMGIFPNLPGKRKKQ